MTNKLIRYLKKKWISKYNAAIKFSKVNAFSYVFYDHIFHDDIIIINNDGLRITKQTKYYKHFQKAPNKDSSPICY